MASFQENLNEPQIPPAVAPARSFAQPETGLADAAMGQGIASVGSAIGSAFKQYDAGQDSKASNAAISGITALTKARQQKKITALQHSIKLGELQRDLNKTYSGREGLIEGAFKASLGAAAPNVSVAASSNVATQLQAKYEAVGFSVLGPGKSVEEYTTYGREVAVKTANAKMENARIDLELKKDNLTRDDHFKLFRKSHTNLRSGMMVAVDGIGAMANTAISLGGNAITDLQSELAGLVNNATNKIASEARLLPSYLVLDKGGRDEADALIKQDNDLARELFDAEKGVFAIKANADVLKHFSSVMELNGPTSLRLLKATSSILGDRVMGSMVKEGLLNNFADIDALQGIVDKAIEDTAGLTGNEVNNRKMKFGQYLSLIHDPSKARGLKTEGQIKTTLDTAQAGALTIEKVATSQDLGEADVRSWANHTALKSIIGLEYAQDAKNTASVANSFTSDAFHTMLEKANKVDPALGDAVADGVITASMQALWAAVQEVGEGRLEYNAAEGTMSATRPANLDFPTPTSPFGNPEDLAANSGTPVSEAFADARVSMAEGARNDYRAKFAQAQEAASTINGVLRNVLRLQKYDGGLAKLNGKELKSYLINTATTRTGIPFKTNDIPASANSDLVGETDRRGALMSVKFQRTLADAKASLVRGIRDASKIRQGIGDATIERLKKPNAKRTYKRNYVPSTGGE